MGRVTLPLRSAAGKKNYDYLRATMANDNKATSRAKEHAWSQADAAFLPDSDRIGLPNLVKRFGIGNPPVRVSADYGRHA